MKSLVQSSHVGVNPIAAARASQRLSRPGRAALAAVLLIANLGALVLAGTSPNSQNQDNPSTRTAATRAPTLAAPSRSETDGRASVPLGAESDPRRALAQTPSYAGDHETAAWPELPTGAGDRPTHLRIAFRGEDGEIDAIYLTWLDGDGADDPNVASSEPPRRSIRWRALWAADVEARPTTSQRPALTRATIIAPGDVNADDQVNQDDTAILLAEWGRAAEFGIRADLNADGVVSLGDLIEVVQRWGEPIPPATERGLFWHSPDCCPPGSMLLIPCQSPYCDDYCPFGPGGGGDDATDDNPDRDPGNDDLDNPDGGGSGNPEEPKDPGCDIQVSLLCPDILCFESDASGQIVIPIVAGLSGTTTPTNIQWVVSGAEHSSDGHLCTLTVTGPSTITVTAIASAGACSASDTCTFPVAQLNVTADANNNGVLDLSDEEAENTLPGCLVLLNDDDDDRNGTEDRSQASQSLAHEDDLEPLRMLVFPEGLTSKRKLTWSIGIPQTLRVFLSADRSGLVEPNVEQDWPPPPMLYAEGFEEGAILKDQIVRFTIWVDGAPCASDSVQVAVIDADIDAPGALPIDAQFAFVSAEFSPYQRDDDNDGDDSNDAPDPIEEALDAMPMRFELRNGPVLLTSAVSQVVEGTAVAALPLGLVPQEPVEAYFRFKSTSVRAEPFAILAGAAATIELEAQPGGFPADATRTREYTAIILDTAGNYVESGTPVWWALDGFGGRIDAAQTQYATDADGRATCVVVAPDFAAEDGDSPKLIVSAGSATFERTLSTVRVSGHLTSQSSSLDIAQSQATRVTLHTNAADGTPVHWTFSNGNVRDLQTTVQGGASEVTVSTAGARAYVGTCAVTATVGDRLAFTEIQFTDSRPFWLKANRWVICADVTTDGEEPVPYAQIDTALFPGDPAMIAPSERLRPYWATSEIEVHGPPHSFHIVSLDEPAHAALVDFEGLLPGNVLQLDASGVGTFRIRSSGTRLDPAPLEVTFRVTPMPPDGTVDPERGGARADGSISARIILVGKTL